MPDWLKFTALIVLCLLAFLVWDFGWWTYQERVRRSIRRKFKEKTGPLIFSPLPRVLPSMKTQQFTQEVEVEGSTQFPIDMLRYDSCVPATETDAHAIGRAIDRETGTKELVRVKLKRFAPEKGREPTAARWKSFGWTVVAHRDL